MGRCGDGGVVVGGWFMVGEEEGNFECGRSGYDGNRFSTNANPLIGEGGQIWGDL